MMLHKQIDADELATLKDSLKRCPAGTLESLLTYRETGELPALNTFLVGVIKRHIEPEYEALMDGELEQLDFIDDLGIDSMTMMEIVMMVELSLKIRVENADLMEIRTYGDLNEYISKKLVP